MPTCITQHSDKTQIILKLKFESITPMSQANLNTLRRIKTKFFKNVSISILAHAHNSYTSNHQNVINHIVETGPVLPLPSTDTHTHLYFTQQAIK